MAISKKISNAMLNASWIRRMFEEGTRMKAEFGEENVFDFSLGNPYLEPPEEFNSRFREIANNPPPGLHRYMPNAGYPATRAAVAEDMKRLTGLDFEGKYIIMTTGAGGGLNVLLKALLDPGDEVIILAPYFVEYVFYIDNHGGKTVIAKTNSQFKFDYDELEKAISDKTKAIIINSPNNPSGVLYSNEDLAELGRFVKSKQDQFDCEIYIISDEPYRKVIFDNIEYPTIMKHFDNSIVVYSHSKDLGLAGERIGYVAPSPNIQDLDVLISACTFTMRTLGFVNAPALMQRLIVDIQQVSIDPMIYQKKRDFLYGELTGMGFKCLKPQGAFYLFPKSPGDDVAFVKACLEEKVLLVPGTGFGTPGHFRLSYCVSDDMLERSIPAFKRIAEKHL